MIKKSYSLGLIAIFIFCMLCISSCKSSGDSESAQVQRKGPFAKAYDLYDEGQFLTAVEYFEKGLIVYPEESAEHLTLAIIYDDHLHDNEKAVMHYEAYLAGSPEEEKVSLVKKWLQKARLATGTIESQDTQRSSDDDVRFHSMDKEIKSLYRLLSDKESKITELDELNKALEHQTEESQETIKRLKSAVDELHEKARQKGVLIPDTREREEKIILQKKVEEYQKAMDLYKQQVKALDTELTRIKNDKKQLEKTIDELNKKVQEAQDHIETGKIPRIDIYRVKKGESLGIIAGYDFIYGDRNKWRVLYEANRDKIANPNLLTPGLLLRIPREE